jgi:hypothetical protein
MDQEGSFLHTISWFMLSCLVALLGAIAWINIQPFQKLAGQLLGSIAQPVSILNSIPIIGSLAPLLTHTAVWVLLAGAAYWAYATGGPKALGAFALVVGLILFGGLQLGIGAIIWAVTQFLECLWVLILFDVASLKQALRESKAVSAEIGDLSNYKSHRDKSIAGKIKSQPYFFIRWAILGALGAYIFDLLVGWSLYPPASSLSAFITAVILGHWSAINMVMLSKLLVMLFAFEGVLVLTLMTWQWIKTHRKGRKSGRSRGLEVE